MKKSILKSIFSFFVTQKKEIIKEEELRVPNENTWDHIVIEEDLLEEDSAYSKTMHQPQKESVIF